MNNPYYCPTLKSDAGPTPAIAVRPCSPRTIYAGESRTTRPLRRSSPYDKPGQWFVVHTQSGYEKKVKSNIEARSLHR